MQLDKGKIRDAVSIFGARAGKFVDLTLADADRLTGEIAAALDAGDAEAAGESAHALKSIMKQIGAMDIGALAEKMQNEGVNGNLENCAALWTEAEPLYIRTREFLQELKDSL